MAYSAFRWLEDTAATNSVHQRRKPYRSAGNRCRRIRTEGLRDADNRCAGIPENDEQTTLHQPSDPFHAERTYIAFDL
jgi:hypothetical protein